MNELLQELKKIIENNSGSIKESGGKFSFEVAVAERKAFLSSKKLVYKAKFSVDEARKELTFSEMLKETGFGLGSGDNDSSPGFGFKTYSYSSGLKGRNETIEEQSTLFGKQYLYKIEFGSIRKQFEKVAQEQGYAFKYNIF